jgi:cytochrome c oxidase assembly protein subunit 15
MAHRESAGNRPIAIWLFGICGMLMVMVVLGGTTRLTGSGLSIMEWAPLRGVLPPLSDTDWDHLFALYRETSQYKLLHEGFGLAGFKQIFWLEWVHRLWGRLIGLAFILPLVWFWWTGRVDRRLWLRLLMLFVLGALQGAVGWFMVASGFAPDSIAVSPYRLVMHLGLATGLYAALLWTALETSRPTERPSAKLRALHRWSIALAVCVGLTILAGAFVSGTHAGLIYNTFPLMDGRLIPTGYGDPTSFANITANVTAVQFNHRLLATACVLLAIFVVGYGLSRAPRNGLRLALAALLGAVLLQYALGIATLLNGVPIPLAAAHQASAFVLLSATLIMIHAARSGVTESGTHT